MGYTIAEFSKTLHGQFINDEATYRCEDISLTHWEISISGTPAVTIKIAEAPPRKIAMLSLPVLDVQFEFESSLYLKEQEQFLKRFFKYFHKGGG